MFELIVDYNTENLEAMCRTSVRLYKRWTVRIARAFCFVVGIIQLLMSALLLAAEGISVTPVVSLFLAAIFLCFALPYYRLTALRSKRMLLKGTGAITVTVDSEGVREKSQKGESFYPFSAICNLCLCRGHYILLIDKQHGIAFSKSMLVSGDWDALGAYLVERCGKPMQNIR